MILTGSQDKGSAATAICISAMKLLLAMCSLIGKKEAQKNVGLVHVTLNMYWMCLGRFFASRKDKTSYEFFSAACLVPNSICTKSGILKFKYCSKVYN